MAALNYSDVSKLLKADFETGKLFWLPRPVDMFKSPNWANFWNRRYAGTEAFTAIGNGYRIGRIHDKAYKAHRILWLLHTGDWPQGEVDHLNGDPLDNRLCNLRDVPHSVNLKNQRAPKNNTSGVTGVAWSKIRSKWLASIFHDGQNYHLGVFVDFDEAVAARRSAEVRFGFGPNHGR